MYRESPGLYTYTFEPAFGDSKEYQRVQLTAIETALRTHTDAIVELQKGTASGTTIQIAPSGVVPGRYRNAVLTIGADGRVTLAEEGPRVDPLPVASRSGLVLTSTSSGPTWTAPRSELPEGGATGQVLTRTASGLAWHTPTITPPGVTMVGLDLGPGLTGSGASITDRGRLDVALAPSGITPGTYAGAAFTVDVYGRVTEAGPLPDNGAVPVGYGEHASIGTYPYWRLITADGPGSPDLDIAILFKTTATGPDLGGVETRPDAWTVCRAFAEDVSVGAITITAITAGGGPTTATIEYSGDGQVYLPGWTLPPQAPWEAGETRSFTLAPSITLDGDVIGTGGAVIETALASTGVTPGAYSNPDVTVDAKGRVTAIANGATASGGSFDPDTPLPYWTMITPDGTEVQVSLSNEPFAWVFEDVTGIPLENGARLVLEDGVTSIAPEA